MIEERTIILNSSNDNLQHVEEIRVFYSHHLSYAWLCSAYNFHGQKFLGAFWNCMHNRQVCTVSFFPLSFTLANYTHSCMKILIIIEMMADEIADWTPTLSLSAVRIFLESFQYKGIVRVWGLGCLAQVPKILTYHIAAHRFGYQVILVAHRSFRLAYGNSLAGQLLLACQWQRPLFLQCSNTGLSKQRVT